MSGGSMDYLSRKVDDVADSLAAGNNPTRQAFARHLSLVARALHEIEWADSSDTVPGEHDEPAMRAALAVGPKVGAGQLVEVIPHGRSKSLPEYFADAFDFTGLLQDFYAANPGRRIVSATHLPGMPVLGRGWLMIVHEEKL